MRKKMLVFIAFALLGSALALLGPFHAAFARVSNNAGPSPRWPTHATRNSSMYGVLVSVGMWPAILEHGQIE